MNCCPAAERARDQGAEAGWVEWRLYMWFVFFNKNLENPQTARPISYRPLRHIQKDLAAASLSLGSGRVPGLGSDTEPGKGFVLCHFVIRLVSPHRCEQELGWRTGGKGVLGLVPAADGAIRIRTAQVQVDEATVIRLSPIVYNKELVKTELLDQVTLLPPRPRKLPRA